MPDTTYPQYLRQDATGAVHVEFQGKIVADGVDITALDDAHAAPEEIGSHSVRWKGVDGNPNIVDAYVRESAVGYRFAAVNVRPPKYPTIADQHSGSAILRLNIRRLYDTSSAGTPFGMDIIKDYDAPIGTGKQNMRVGFVNGSPQADTSGPANPLLIDSDGRSDFLQMEDPVALPFRPNWHQQPGAEPVTYQVLARSRHGVVIGLRGYADCTADCPWGSANTEIAQLPFVAFCPTNGQRFTVMGAIAGIGYPPMTVFVQTNGIISVFSTAVGIGAGAPQGMALPAGSWIDLSGVVMRVTRPYGTT